MKEIILNASRKSRPNYMKYVAIVDDEDYEMLMQYNWIAKIDKHTTYAYAHINNKNTKMHRLIMDAKDGEIIDHADCNGLHNWRSNLRNCTQSQNMKNKRAQGKSKYVGVISVIMKWKDKVYGEKWRAQARITGVKSQYIGTFKTEIEAAIAHDKVVLKHNGEFARLNFPCIKMWDA